MSDNNIIRTEIPVIRSLDGVVVELHRTFDDGPFDNIKREYVRQLLENFNCPTEEWLKYVTYNENG